MSEMKQQSAVRAWARTLPLVTLLALLAVLFLQQAPPAQAAAPGKPSIDSAINVYDGVYLYLCETANCETTDSSITGWESQYIRQGSAAWTDGPSLTGSASPPRTLYVGGLTQVGSYTFRVRAVNADGASPWSGEVAVINFSSQPNLPNPPVNVRVTPQPSGLGLSWDPPEYQGNVAPIAGYVVRYRAVGAQSDTDVATSRTQVALGNLSSSTSYNIRLWAYYLDPDTGNRVDGRQTYTFSATPLAADKTFTIPAAVTGTESEAPGIPISLGQAAPAGGVSISLTASYAGQTATAADVVSVPQTVTITEGEFGINAAIPLVDDMIDEDDESFVITATTSTTGWNRSSSSPAQTVVTIVDNDTAGLTVTPTTLNITEGASGTYTVVLDSQPTASVTVTPASSDAGAAGVTPATLTFTTGIWQTPQTLTVTGVQDSDTADETVTVSHTVQSGDSKYAAAAVPAPVTVQVADDDVSANPTAPDAPTGLTLAASAGQIDAAWSAPVSNGGSTLTGYDVEYKASTATTWRDAGHAGLTLSAAITGLPNGVQHDVRVRAKNAIGDSAWSSVAQATPSLPTVEFGRNRTVLTSTLSVLSFSTLRGCFSSVNACTAQLTSNSFTHESVAYQVRVVSLGSGTLVLTFDKAIPSDLVRFNVGSSQFAFEDAVKSNNDQTVSWSNPGLTWAVGDTVSLSIEATPPALVASEGDSVEVTVTINPPLEQASSVTVTVVSGSPMALVNQDYTVSGLQSGETLVLPAGAGSASFYIHAVADYVTEGSAEGITYELSAVSGAPYTLGRDGTEVLILDTSLTPTGPPGVPAAFGLSEGDGEITASWDLTPSNGRTPPRQLRAPTRVTLYPDPVGNGMVSWSPPTRDEGITGYEVHYKNTDAPDLPAYACVPACRVDGDPAGRTRPAEAPRFANPATGWTDVSAADGGVVALIGNTFMNTGTSYDVRVRTLRGGVPGPWSETLTRRFGPPQDGEFVPAVTGYELRYRVPTLFAKLYPVGDDPDRGWVRVFVDAEDASPHVIDGLDNYKRYNVQARAWNAFGYGGWAGPLGAEPADPAAGRLWATHQDTLTLPGGAIGCDNSATNDAHKCYTRKNTSDPLGPNNVQGVNTSNPSFTYYDTYYYVEEVTLKDGVFRLRLDKDVPDGLRLGGYLSLLVGRPDLDPNPHVEVLKLPGDSDFGADAKLLTWSGVDGTWSSIPSNSKVIQLFAHESPRDQRQQIEISGPAQASEGTEVKVRVNLQPQGVASQVHLNLRGSARYGEDYWLRGAGVHVLSDELAIADLRFPASQVQSYYDLTLAINADAESEAAETISMTAEIVFDPGNPNLPDVLTPEWLEHRIDSASLTIAENIGAPAGLWAAGAGAGVINVTWDPPAADGPTVTGYDVQYKESSSSTWTDAGSTGTKGADAWTSTLTVDVVANSNNNGQSQGCDSVLGLALDDCSTALSDDNFTYKGASYTLQSIAYDTFQKILFTRFAPPLPADLRAAGVLHVDGTAHALSAASSVANQLSLGQLDLSWSDGQTVSLILKTLHRDITGLTGGTTYDIRVRAREAAGPGPWSAPASATPGGGSPAQGGQPGGVQQSPGQQQQALEPCPVATEPPVAGQKEPYNVCVTPGDGALTVTWDVSPRDGFEEEQIRHALRWSQVSGVWGNPPGQSGAAENGIVVEGGIASYVITGLTNDVAAGVFVRSFTGGSLSERSEHSSQWVRTKGDHTTPTAGQPPPQVTPRTYSVTAAATAAESWSAVLTLTLSDAAPTGGVEFSVSAGYSGSAGSADVGSIVSPVTVPEGSDTLTIVIPTVDDAVDEDDETFTVTVAAVTPGWDQAASGDDTATVTITDDDTAGVTVTPTALNVAEDGSATYTVVLDSQPTADVTVTAASGDDGAASVAPASLTFTPSGWHIAQTFTVSGVGDDDSNDESVAITHGASSGDAKYQLIPMTSVSVAVADDDAQQQQQQPAPEPTTPGQLEPANVQVTPGDGTLTVTWEVSPRDGFENEQIKHALRWSQVSGVWGNPPDPKAGGREDGLSVEGGVTSYVITGLENGVATGVFVRSFTGGSYSERSEHSSKWVRTKGDHTTPRAGQSQQQQVTPKTFSLSAAASAAEGGDAGLTLTLSEAAPAGGVEFSVSAGYSGSADSDDVGSIASPVMVPGGSDTLTIVIPTGDDAVDEDDETFTVTVAAVTAGWDPASAGQDAATVTIVDDDTAGVTVTPTSLSIAEDGSASYTVVLDSQPTGDVFVTPFSDDEGANYDAFPVVFTEENWDTPRSITVSGVDDADSNDESVAITHEVFSGDAKYLLIPVASVAVTVADDDVQQQQQQQVTPKTYALSGAASAAEGGDAALTLTLSEAAPAGGVEFSVSLGYDGSADSGDLGSVASPVTVPEGSDTLQIAVPTVDDAVDEDDETFTVTIAAVTPGWDPAGSGQDTATVTIVDDDTAGVTVTPTALNVAEDGSVTYTVVLDSRPTADVTVTASGNDDGAAGVSPASLTFTPSGWNVPLTFTVSGVGDDDRDDESVGVSHLASSNDARYEGIAVASVAVAVADTTPPPAPESTCPEEAEPPEPGQREPYNVCVTPGDGTLTVTWTVASRDGFEDGQIKHSLRWSQEPGVWANPHAPDGGGREDGIPLEDGETSYTITGLENGVATGVFVRSFTGGSYSERSPHSSKWVRTKGEHTTPKAE